MPSGIKDMSNISKADFTVDNDLISPHYGVSLEMEMT